MSPYADHDPALPGVGFAVTLRARRLAAGLTQDELAHRSGLGVRTVRELERGRVLRPQRGTVTLLAGALQLTGDARDAFIAAATPRRTPARRIAMLPPEPELIGRERDIADIADLLGTADLVTLVGLAGVGKTCVALAVAHRFAATGQDVAAVSVSTVSTVDDVLAAAAAVFGAHRAEELSVREGLLLIDGVDRSPTGARGAIQWLRARAPALKILATSLSGANVSGVGGGLGGGVGVGSGVDWRIEPLEVPPATETTPLEGSSQGRGQIAPPQAPAFRPLAELRQYPAVALFLTRLRLVRREPVREADAPALAELVRRLCGLPLAIELAAARGRILEVPELLERYGNRVLDLGATDLDGAGRESEQAPWRLRDAVAASYRLLAADEQHALRRLATFRGRWSLELAEAILGDRPDLDVEAVLDRLVGLGLVSVRGQGELRFRLLDVVSDFASEQSASAGELGVARARHAEVVTRLVARTAADLAGHRLASAVAGLDQLNGDIRSALRYASARDPHTALRLGAAIPRWCRFRGRDREGWALLRRLLDDRRTADADPVLRARAQVGAAMLAAAHGQGVTELPATESALETFLAAGDIDGELAARSVLGGLWQAIGGHQEARRHGEAVLALATRADRSREIAVAQNNLTWQDIRVGDLTQAARRLSAAIQRALVAGDDRLRALAQANLAEVARLDGRRDDAVELARSVLPRVAELGDPGHLVRALGTLGRTFAEAGRFQDASRVLDELSPHSPGAPGAREMITGYLGLTTGDRVGALAAFTEAADQLAGRDDARDVLEALVGVAASADDPQRRRDALAEIAGLCERGGLSLLPRDHALLDGFHPPHPG
jgi:predicted ATPase